MVNSGLCRTRHAFVAEVAVDFEHALEAAHHQALEVQLGAMRRNISWSSALWCVVEGLGIGAAGDGVQHRRFDFQEAGARP